MENKSITYIDFKEWNNKVIKGIAKGLGIIFAVELLLFFFFKPTPDMNRGMYLIQFIFLPTVIQGIIIGYLLIVANILDKHLSQYSVSLLMILGEIAFTIVAIAIHSSVSFICIALIYPIMFTPAYKIKSIGWITCILAIIGYALVIFGVIPSTVYKPNNTPMVYLIIFASLVIVTTILALTMKDINIQFSKNEEVLLKEAERMKYVSQIDSLTQLYNHKAFYNKLDQLLEVAIEDMLHIVVVDIDDFKKINDTYGHRVGDRVIVAVSNIIRDTLKGNDFASRYGGEEFVAVYTNIDKNNVIDIAEAIRKAIEINTFTYRGEDNTVNTFNCTVSVGVSSFNNDTNTSAELFEEADRRLYTAKNVGKNIVVYK